MTTHNWMRNAESKENIHGRASATSGESNCAVTHWYERCFRMWKRFNKFKLQRMKTNNYSRAAVNRRRWGSVWACPQLFPQHGDAAADGGGVHSAHCYSSALLRSHHPPVCYHINPLKHNCDLPLRTCFSVISVLQTERPYRQPVVLKKCRKWSWTCFPGCVGPTLEPRKGGHSGLAGCWADWQSYVPSITTTSSWADSSLDSDGE